MASLIKPEDDVESSGGRSSEELGETDAFLNSKSPYTSVRETSKFQSDKCPICLRRASWQYIASLLRLKRKQRAMDCPHDQADIEEHLQAGCIQPARRRRRKCKLVASLFLVAFALFGIWNTVTLFIGLGPLLFDPSLAIDRFFPNWGQPGEPGENVSGYPTDFTRDVSPIPCHSHNDYWRRVPLYEALHYGCTGVEADVWLFDDEELYVGHTTASLTKNRTFKSLYVDPLVNILDDMNPDIKFGKDITPRKINGVFDEAPEQTLVMLVDFKMDGRKQFPVVWRHLQALRAKDYLTYFNGSQIIERPITVVATGNAPFDMIAESSTRRDIFFDAPLDKLADAPSSVLSANNWRSKVNPLLSSSSTSGGQGNTGTDPTKGADQFTSSNSYYASLNFKQSIGFPWRGRLSHEQLKKVRSQIKSAHEKGLKARYWNTPTWPVGLRNHVWSILIEEGVDYLNVDDLRSAKMVDWNKSWEMRWGY